MQPRLLQVWKSLAYLYQKEIWQPTHLRDRSLKGRAFALVRVVSITLTGLKETRATSRAAALSFSTLLGLAPLIGIAVLIAGLAMGPKNSLVVTDKLNELIRYIAPQVAHLEDDSKHLEFASDAASDPAKPGQRLAVNPELINFINNSIIATRSSAGGVVASVSLIFIILMLFTSVEQAFNEIWGVRRGRSWLVRIVSYWTILTLGAVLFFGAMGALSATTFISYFRQNVQQLPFGSELASVFSLAAPMLSTALVVIILTFFYRYIPNTHVFWRAALTGAAVVAVLLLLNNLLAFSYFRRVDMTRSLYGPLALLPVLMIGLYVFWLFVLVGGQISYAVQNVHFRNSQAAWANLSEFTRERLTLIVFLTIARRFQACQPACTASELGRTIKVPTQVLNECLNRLIDLNLVSPIPPSSKHGAAADYLYQPARPLNVLTLGDFKRDFENFGHDPASEGLGKLDPVVKQYEDVLALAEASELYTTSLDKLFLKYTFELPIVAEVASEDTTTSPKLKKKPRS